MGRKEIYEVETELNVSPTIKVRNLSNEKGDIITIDVTDVEIESMKSKRTAASNKVYILAIVLIALSIIYPFIFDVKDFFKNITIDNFAVLIYRYLIFLTTSMSFFSIRLAITLKDYKNKIKDEDNKRYNPETEKDFVWCFFNGYIFPFVIIAAFLITIMHMVESLRGSLFFILTVPLSIIMGLNYDILKYLYKELKP
jgi:hypothetical protein